MRIEDDKVVSEDKNVAVAIPTEGSTPLAAICRPNPVSHSLSGPLRTDLAK